VSRSLKYRGIEATATSGLAGVQGFGFIVWLKPLGFIVGIFSVRLITLCLCTVVLEGISFTRIFLSFQALIFIQNSFC